MVNHTMLHLIKARLQPFIQSRMYFGCVLSYEDTNLLQYDPIMLHLYHTTYLHNAYYTTDLT